MRQYRSDQRIWRRAEPLAVEFNVARRKLDVSARSRARLPELRALAVDRDQFWKLHFRSSHLGRSNDWHGMRREASRGGHRDQTAICGSRSSLLTQRR